MKTNRDIEPSATPAKGLVALDRDQRRAGITLSLPAAILIVLLVLGPAGLVIAFSFTDYRLGVPNINFVAFDNYMDMFTDRDFWNSLTNTLIYVAIVIPGAVLGGLGAALLIDSRRYFRRFYRVAYFMPVAGTLVALATAWQLVLHPSFGIANEFINLFGAERLPFFGDGNLALFTLAGIGIWELIGFNMVLFLAGLSTIPDDLYEAAALDGAGEGLKRFLLVTWPMLGPVTMFVVVLSAIRGFRVFETVAVITQGGPDRATEVLLYSLFQEGFKYFRIGSACALAVVFLVITLVLTLMQARAFDRQVSYRR